MSDWISKAHKYLLVGYLSWGGISRTMNKKILTSGGFRQKIIRQLRTVFEYNEERQLGSKKYDLLRVGRNVICR